MVENRHTDQSFAAILAPEMIRLGAARGASPQAIAKWRVRQSLPRELTLRAIRNVTGGIVTADSFLFGDFAEAPR